MASFKYMSDISRHIPALVNEVITGLNLKPGANVIDATLGGGGHAQAILEATAPNGRLLGIDWDSAAVERASRRLAPYQNRLILKTGNYRDIKTIAYESEFHQIDAILLDLGLSTDQLKDAARGFSFQTEAPLDMRFSDQGALTASQIVNTWSEKDLAHIFRTYGEDRHAARIAQTIVASRQRAPINSVLELVALVGRGAGGRGRGKIHPATRIFQALRLATNHELDNLQAALPDMVAILSRGGRLAIISWHSLEDRIVKTFFREEAKTCVCPPAMPLCQCQHQPRLRLINKKVIMPSSEEARRNPSARSAKLRLAEKI